ncbi:MAG: DUF3313 domain-containing protein [bacterium]|nr:DUF3313 domain-containing protein [bacterium]
MRFAPLVMAAALVALGCATGPTRQARRTETAGFLGSYSQLQKGGKDDALLVYRNPEADFTRYDKVLVEPVAAWGSASTDVDMDRLQVLIDYLDAALRHSLAQDYEIVERTGPGVLRLRVAITEADGSNVPLDIVSAVIPQIRLLTAVVGLGTTTQLFVGSAGIEAEILDGMTDERLLAAVDRRGGGRTFEGSTASWDDVQKAFDFWAERVRTRLAEERAR